MNRGKPFHRRHVEEIAGLWRRQPCEVFTEYVVKLGGRRYYVDAFVNLGGYKIAIEYEMTTRYVLVNATVALRVCHELQLVFPTARLRDQARSKLAASLPRTEMERTAFLLQTCYEARTYIKGKRFLTGNRRAEKTGKAESESGL